MADAANPLNIVMLKVDDRETAYIPLDMISETEVERLRAEHLDANTIDSTAEEMGDPPPGIKPMDEQIAAETADALANPLEEQGSPADALG